MMLGEIVIAHSQAIQWLGKKRETHHSDTGGKFAHFELCFEKTDAIRNKEQIRQLLKRQNGKKGSKRFLLKMSFISTQIVMKYLVLCYAVDSMNIAQNLWNITDPYISANFYSVLD